MTVSDDGELPVSGDVVRVARDPLAVAGRRPLVGSRVKRLWLARRLLARTLRSFTVTAVNAAGTTATAYWWSHPTFSSSAWQAWLCSAATPVVRHRDTASHTLHGDVRHSPTGTLSSLIGPRTRGDGVTGVKRASTWACPELRSKFASVSPGSAAAGRSCINYRSRSGRMFGTTVSNYFGMVGQSPAATLRQPSGSRRADHGGGYWFTVASSRLPGKTKPSGQSSQGAHGAITGTSTAIVVSSGTAGSSLPACCPRQLRREPASPSRSCPVILS